MITFTSGSRLARVVTLARCRTASERDHPRRDLRSTAWTHPRCAPRRRCRRCVVDLDAIAANVGDAPRAGPARPRSWRWSRPTGTATGWCRAAGPRSPAAPPGSASPRSRRRSRCARPGSPRRTLAWLAPPGAAWQARDRGRRRPVGERALGARRDRRRRPRGRPAGPGAPQDRHRAGPRRRAGRGLAGAGRRRARRRGRRRAAASSASGRTSRTPTRPGHPTTAAPDRRGSPRRSTLAERAGVRPEVRHLANSAATLTLPAAHFDLVRPGIAVYGISPMPETASVGRARARPGDDAAGAGLAREAGPGRARRLVRPPVHDRRARRRSR